MMSFLKHQLSAEKGLMEKGKKSKDGKKSEMCDCNVRCCF